MKPVYKCDWCKTMGSEEEILEHEKTCMRNINLHSCHTCDNRKGLTTLEWKVGVNIPENHYIQHCDKWEEGKPLDFSGHMGEILDVFFGKDKTVEKEELSRILAAFKLVLTALPIGGMVASLIAFIAILGKVNDPATLGPHVAVAILTILYSLIIEVLLLPVAAKLWTLKTE